MRKAGLIIVAVVMLAVVCLLFMEDRSVPRDRYLPEVTQILEAKPDVEALKRSRYAGLLGIGALENANYMDTGAEQVLSSYQLYEEVRTGKLKADAFLDHRSDYHGGYKTLLDHSEVNGEKYEFPCTDLRNFDCVTQTWAKRDVIRALEKQNSVLLERYVQIMELDGNESPIYGFMDVSFLPANFVVALGNWRLSMALVALNDGRVDEGFQILQEERHFTEKMLSEPGMVVEGMAGMERFYIYMHVLDVLMSDPAFQVYWEDPRFGVLLVSFPQGVRQGAGVVLENERDIAFRFLAMDEDGKNFPFVLPELFYNPYMTLNLDYVLREKMIGYASLSFAEASDLYVRNELPDVLKEIETECSKHWSVLNFEGYGLICADGRERLMDYVLMYDDMHVYLALMQTKYALMRAGVDGDGAKSFLEAKGLRNPYTQQPWSLNADKGMLHMTWMSHILGEPDGKELWRCIISDALC